MNRLNPILARLFSVFELIVSFLIINFVIVVGSVLSLFLLFPVLIAGAFHLGIKLYKDKDSTAMLFNYFGFVRTNIITSFKTGILPMVSSMMIILIVVVVNPLIVDLISPGTLFAIQFVQGFMIYVLSSVFLMSLIFVAYSTDKESIYIMRDTFLTLFAKPIRPLFAYLATFLIGYYLFFYLDIYFLMFAIPVLTSIYYIAISVHFERHK